MQSLQWWLSIFALLRCVLGYPQVALESPIISEQLWDALPGPNATGNFIFQTVISLLQHWPNTKYGNGERT
jgi:hypothetical protein